LEAQFWEALAEIAAAEGKSVPGVVLDVDRQREGGLGLSAALRLYVLAWYRERSLPPRD
jgi:predicted DNA-binding ribbon-helix-helix protein